MNQEQRRKLYEKGFKDGVDTTQDYMIKALYGACALAAHREFGFGAARCQKLLMTMNHIITDVITDAEILQNAWRECGLKIVFDDGIEPFQLLEKGETEVWQNGEPKKKRGKP